MPTRLMIRPLAWLRPPRQRARADINAAAHAAGDAPDVPQQTRAGLPMPPGRMR